METAFADVTVAVDASDEAQRGIEFAIALGHKGAHVHFCSVVDPALTYVAAGGVGGPTDMSDTLAAMEDEARTVCATAVSTARAHGVAADSQVMFGAVGQEIGRYVFDRHSEALIIGTHRLRTCDARGKSGRHDRRACAERLRSPMIFIGTHGRSDLARLVVGSVAAGVVERARMPVTVIRAAIE